MSIDTSIYVSYTFVCVHMPFMSCIAKTRRGKQQEANHTGKERRREDKCMSQPTQRQAKTGN